MAGTGPKHYAYTYSNNPVFTFIVIMYILHIHHTVKAYGIIFFLAIHNTIFGNIPTILFFFLPLFPLPSPSLILTNTPVLPPPRAAQRPRSSITTASSSSPLSAVSRQPGRCGDGRPLTSSWPTTSLWWSWRACRSECWREMSDVCLQMYCIWRLLPG